MPELTDTAKQMHAQLSTELHTLNQTWRYVFDMTQDRLAANTFNRVSAPFFGTVLSALFEYAITILSRLLDREIVGGRKNCCLEALAIAANYEPVVRSLDAMRSQAQPLLAYRNKQIAHLDRVITLQDADDQPQLFTWVGTYEAIAGLRQWMNAFEASMNLPVEQYDVGEGWGEVDELLQLLRAKCA